MSNQSKTSIHANDLTIQKSREAIADCYEIEAMLQKQLQETIEIINQSNLLIQKS
jgi:hypothetical protein